MTIQKFSQLGVKSKNLTGDKIAIDEIIDKEVTVFEFRIADSNYGKRDAMYTAIQIEHEGQKRVIFTGSGVLKADLESMPPEAFPFTTTIVKVEIKDKKWYKFT